jgi:uncharacterized repeat protein (TIGR01451 family)
MTRSRSTLALITLFSIFALTVCSSEPTAPPEPDRADLSVTKSGDADPVTVGDEIVYTITAANAGPDEAGTVQLTDAVPAGTSFVSATSSQGSCVEASGTVTCALGSLTSGGTATVTLRVTADQAGQVTNTASVSSDVDDPNGGNNSDSETTTIQLVEADLSVTKFGPAGAVSLSANIVYDITVRNDGPGDATGVEVTDVVPDGTSYVSAEASQGSCAETAGTVTCDLGDLADGEHADVTLTLRADEEGSVANTVTVSSDAPDPDESDNSDSESTLVVAFTTDLEITKVDDEDPVAVGEEILYTLTAKNRGPNDAAGVIVTDTVPEGTTFVSAVASQGECSEDAGTVSCALGTLPSLFEATVELTLRAEELGDVINTGRVTGSVVDSDDTNNSDTETTAIKRLADLSVLKDDDQDPVAVGEDIVYSILVTNNGPNDATDVMVTDTLPPTTDFNDVTSTGGSCDESRDILTCDLGTLAAGEFIRITLMTTTQQVGFVDNRAWAVSSVQDPNPDNDSDRAGTNVTGPQADLSITKTHQGSPVAVGDTIVYDIDVINHGPADVSNATVTDSIPAGTSYVSATVSPGTCGEGGGVVTCTIPTLPNGVGTTIVLTLQANQAGQVTNTATVNPPPTVEDSDTSNNAASEVTTVN